MQGLEALYDRVRSAVRDQQERSRTSLLLLDQRDGHVSSSRTGAIPEVKLEARQGALLC